MENDDTVADFPKGASLFVEADTRDLVYNAFSQLSALENKQLSPADEMAWTNTTRVIAPQIFNDLVFDLKSILARRPYVVLIKGLRFDANNSLFRAIASSLGIVVDPFQATWSTALTKLHPKSDLAFDGYGTLTEQLHTDGTNWLCPNRYTCLLCLRPDQRGCGRSWIMDTDTLWESFEIQNAVQLLRDLADTPVPWQIANEMGGGIHWQPIISNERIIRWMRYTIECGLANVSENRRIAIQNLLNHFNTHLSEVEGSFKFLLESHELLIVDNYKCLHARTPVPLPQTSKREFLRAKVVSAPVN